MIRAKSFKGETVAVMGLARSGLASVRSLVEGGARVLAWDDRADRAEEAAKLGAEITDLARADFSKISCLVLSPGIPHTYPAPHPVAERARAQGVAIIGDIEILMRECPDVRTVGVTGTNGKSTTTALIGHILQSAGLPVEVGGNIGRPVLEFDLTGKDATHVLELSSYQLELTPSLSCDVALLLNVSPDHLDRHGGMTGYIAAKRRIFTNMAKDAAAIVGVDDETTAGIHASFSDYLGVSVLPVSGLTAPEGGIGVDRDTLVDRRKKRTKKLVDLSGAPTLPGSHNAQNAAAAAATALTLGVKASDVADAIQSFAGLAHRQEIVGHRGKVIYVNDSKATNADAASRALSCYPTIFWIVGGIAKDGGIDCLAPYFERVRHAFLIGESMEAFAATLAGRVPYSASCTLEHAVRDAHVMAARHTRSGAVVLLSPAAASFDQFDSYEARGDRFRALVEERLAALGTVDRRAS